MSQENPPEMYYRMLGTTGLQVSVLSFGFWATYGVKDGLTEDDGVAMAKKCMSVARKSGINLFDNAETYGNPMGAAEEVMGEAMSQLRDEDPDILHLQDVYDEVKALRALVEEKALK